MYYRVIVYIMEQGPQIEQNKTPENQIETRISKIKEIQDSIYLQNKSLENSRFAIDKIFSKMAETK